MTLISKNQYKSSVSLARISATQGPQLTVPVVDDCHDSLSLSLSLSLCLSLALALCCCRTCVRVLAGSFNLPVSELRVAFGVGSPPYSSSSSSSSTFFLVSFRGCFVLLVSSLLHYLDLDFRGADAGEHCTRATADLLLHAVRSSAVWQFASSSLNLSAENCPCCCSKTRAT